MRGKHKQLNILIVGYGGRSVKSFKVNKNLLKGLVLISLTGLVSLVSFSAYTYVENRDLKANLSKVKEENIRLASMLEEERERNKYLESFKDKVKELEGKLINIDKFLRRKGIRRIPSGVGGYGEKVDLIDIDYITFLTKEADKLHKYLERIPIGPPVWGRITSRYGYRIDPFSKRYEFHKGIDIKAPWGTPVRATAEGKVTFAGWKPGYGKTVIIRHAFGFKTLYAHLSKITVKRGRWVKSGQIIGYVGSTGKSTGPHVHYEVWRYSKKENPIKYMYVRW